MRRSAMAPRQSYMAVYDAHNVSRSYERVNSTHRFSISSTGIENAHVLAVRTFLFFLFPSILATQTLQFAAAFGGSCESTECDLGNVWYPDTVTSITVDSSGNN